MTKYVKVRVKMSQIVRETRIRKAREAAETFPERMAACGCRQLTGREFERRKAELEAREARLAARH